MRVWIDTDLGTDVDDALALAYGLRHPELEVVGVSTVFGDVGLRSVMVRRLLELAGHPDVPVVTGLGAPLTPGRVGLMLGHEGIGLLDSPAPAPRTEDAGRKDEVVRALSEALDAARPDALLAIGPLTNLGALAEADCALPPLAIMGGRFSDVALEGMIEAIGEWNWYCDPVAVGHVLAATQTAPRVVPAEVTFTTELLPEDPAQLAGGDAFDEALARLCDEWLRAQRERFGSKRPRVALHDPITLATLVEPSLCRFESIRATVDARGYGHRADEGTAIELAVASDPAAVRDDLMKVLLTR